MDNLNELKNLPFSIDELNQKIAALPDLTTLRAMRGKGPLMTEQDAIMIQQKIDIIVQQAAKWGSNEDI